jgi:lipopolysaccharide/colanic/teichoic acid biosynthesis glycosyltransferase
MRLMGFFDPWLVFTAITIEAQAKGWAGPARVRFYPVIKRWVEFCLAALLLVVFAPLFVLIALAIRLDSPGPALFRQTRVGRNGTPFTFYKFRSMPADVDTRRHHAFLKAFVSGRLGQARNGERVYKPVQAEQVTRVGRLLRKTSLDELPQLFNVLKGEMSFVGPRPNIPAEVGAYVDWHRRRLAVLPGITGWAQINGRSRITFDQIVRYDIDYIENESLAMDLRILLWTLPTVLKGNGAE